MSSGELSDHVFHLYVIRSDQRELLQSHMLKFGVQTVIHYPIPAHHQKAYSSWSSKSLQITERIHKEVLSLPIGSYMNSDDVRSVIDAVNKF